VERQVEEMGSERQKEGKGVRKGGGDGGETKKGKEGRRKR
jgi:hypothetical protein